MKKSIRNLTATIIVFMLAIANPIKAQNIEKEMLKLTKKYQDAYNNKDAEAIESFYTKDAVRIDQEGGTLNGSKAIGAVTASFFETSDLKIRITVVKSVTGSNGTVISSGTFEGLLDRNPISGNYTNTCVKEDGHWKISKSVLTN